MQRYQSGPTQHQTGYRYRGDPIPVEKDVFQRVRGGVKLDDPLRQEAAKVVERAAKTEFYWPVQPHQKSIPSWLHVPPFYRYFNMRILFGCALVAVAAFSSLFSGTSLAEVPKVGDSVPDFEMQGSDGKTYKAKDFIGKQAVIIAWFPRAFTGGCTKECKSMKESGEMLKKFDVAYFTASTDPVEKNADFAKSLDLDYPILCDPKGTNAKLFGILSSDGSKASRTTFIIGKNGKVLSLPKVNTDTHGKDLAEELEKLGVEKKASKK